MRVELTVMVRVDHAGHDDAVLHVQHQIGCLAVRGKVCCDPHPVDHVAFHIYSGIADFAEISIVRRQKLDVFQKDGACWDPPSRASSTHHTPPSLTWTLA